VPDVSGDADPNTGYNILVDGEHAVIGGTSAVAPLWAGLVARINQQMGNQQSGKTIGFLNPLIYAQAVEASGFHDITQGNNGAFSAADGWDPCTGLGTPDGVPLGTALTATPAARAAASARAGGSQEISVRPLRGRAPLVPQFYLVLRTRASYQDIALPHAEKLYFSTNGSDTTSQLAEKLMYPRI
jgi:hypothetical protein